MAPSAHNRQPWRFAVVTNPQMRQSLALAMAESFRSRLAEDGESESVIAARLAKSQKRIEDAPVAVVLCLDMTEMDVYPDDERNQLERVMAAQSAALAGGTLLLAAHAEGLAGVWLCAPLFARQEVRSVLDLPVSWDPQAMLLIGYPDDQAPGRTRKPLAEVARFYS